jgi:hypothetical protein
MIVKVLDGRSERDEARSGLVCRYNHSHGLVKH